MPIVRICCCTLLIGCSAATPLAGQARWFRQLDGRNGLSPAVVTALAQDRAGLLWIGTAGGLFRYDGARIERWARDRLDTWVATIAVSPAGDVVVIDQKAGALLEVDATGAHGVDGPDTSPLLGVDQAAFDAEGGLWVSRGPVLMRRPAGSSAWRRMPLDSVDGTAPRTIAALAGAEVLVPTRKAVWRVGPEAPPRRLADLPDVVAGLGLPDGRILALTFGGVLVELGATGAPPRAIGTGRGIALAQRNGTIWASFDRSLVAVLPGGAIETLAAPEGISGSGPLLVDHEGSLWMGAWNGLFQFPEPDTRIWGANHGLPSDHVRYVSPLGDSLWIDTWQGAGIIRTRAAGWVAGPIPSQGAGYRHSIDPRGTIWTGSSRGIVRIEAGRSSVAWPGPAYLRSAVESGDGRLFFATTAGLLATARSGASLRRIGLPLSSDSAAIEAVQIDRAGRLWIAGENRLCDRRVPGGATPDPPAHDAGWTCRAKPAAAPTNALVEAPSGAIWLALGNRGVWRLTRTGWESIAGTRELATIGVANLVPSRAGGFWVLGADVVVRVIEDTAHTAGWRVVERLSGWHGLPHSSAADIHEQADGTLWIATMMGVVRVPASVRREAAPSPRVLLVDGSVDADAVALDRPIRLPSDRNRLRLRFAAITYRDPLLLRYQVRALPGDEWETVAGTAEFRWVDLDAGQYRAEVRASLDGEHWSAEPASFAFQVLPPWYRTRWALAAFAAVAAAIAVLVHRARVAVHVELERQRMRIAMDLHDELGSGLGSIGILAGVLQSSPPPGAPGHAREIAADIGGTAAALGSALSDIVWALDRRSAGLDAIASRLAEHGDRVFPNGAARFATRFPRDWPDRRFDLGERRNLLLIGLEALHNAARHAHASRVELRIDAGGAGFTLEVRDDGVGLPADAEARGGLGLASMRSRARQIGAELRLLPGPAGGTIVCVRMNGRPSRSTSTRSERPGQRAGRHHRG